MEMVDSSFFASSLGDERLSGFAGGILANLVKSDMCASFHGLLNIILLL